MSQIFKHVGVAPRKFGQSEGGPEFICPPAAPSQSTTKISEQFVARPDDMYICTFPKSGTTWTVRIVELILGCNLSEKISFGVSEDDLIPWLESLYRKENANAILEGKNSPRYFKTHSPVGVVKAKKMIMCYRNPLDVWISFWHHIKRLGMFVEGADTSFTHFFKELVLTDSIYYGSWLDWHEEYLKAEEDGDINPIWLRFEDMKRTPAEGVEKIMNFLGCEEDITVDEIVRQSSLETMKKVYTKEYGKECEAGTKEKKFKFFLPKWGCR